MIPEGALDAYKASPGYNAEQNTWYGIKLSEPQEEVHINATINGTAVDGASLEKQLKIWCSCGCGDFLDNQFRKSNTGRSGLFEEHFKT